MIFERNVPGSTEVLQKATVGLAGCGGLGSNVAVALTRAGVGRLILTDFDLVELSNLNRQYFFQADVGLPKTEALSKHLKAINPEIDLQLHPEKLTPQNVPSIFNESEILVEAFDKAESKAWLVESWVSAFPDRPMVIGNGLSGAGGTYKLCVRREENLYFCGDGETEMDLGLCSARVAIVANMQANVVISLLLGLEDV